MKKFLSARAERPRRIKQLEQKNRKLEQIAAEPPLDKQIRQDALPNSIAGLSEYMRLAWPTTPTLGS